MNSIRDSRTSGAIQSELGKNASQEGPKHTTSTVLVGCVLYSACQALLVLPVGIIRCGQPSQSIYCLQGLIKHGHKYAAKVSFSNISSSTERLRGLQAAFRASAFVILSLNLLDPTNKNDMESI